MNNEYVQSSTSTLGLACQTILSRNVFHDDQRETGVGSIGQFLSQSAAAGAIGCYVYFLGYIILIPNPYNLIVAFFIFPFFLAGSLVIGLIPGLTIWGVTRLFGRSLNPVSQLLLSFFGLALCLAPVVLKLRPTPFVFSALVILIVVFSVATGSTVGSQLRPWHFLSQGLSSQQHESALAKIPLVILRIILLTGAALSGLSIIAVFQGEVRLSNLYTVLALAAYFTTGLFLVFKRLSLWLRTTLVVLLHLPVAFLAGRPWESLWPAKYLLIAYFAVWFLFLIMQSKSLRSLIRDELNYYILD